MKIAETFTSIQGEGHLTGKLMRFIRLAGCNVRTCPMHPINKPAAPCDTDWSMSSIGDPERMAAEALDEVGPNGWVCITGGEPLVRKNIQWLFRALARHLEKGALDELTLTTNASQLTITGRDLMVSPKPAAQGPQGADDAELLREAKHTIGATLGHTVLGRAREVAGLAEADPFVIGQLERQRLDLEVVLDQHRLYPTTGGKESTATAP